MDYPDSLTLAVLQAENVEYAASKLHLERIALLCAGGWELREALPMFLKQRAGEERIIYETRLDKFTYSNVLGSALSQLAAKFSNADVHLSGAEPNAEFWDEFREDTSGLGRTEKQLVEKLFSSLMRDGRIFAQVDLPASDLTPQSRAEQEALGLSPRIVLYPALQVPAWGESNGVLQWVKTFQIAEDNSNPTKAPMMRATWTYVDAEQIVRYGAPVSLKGGKLLHILNEQGEEIDTNSTEIKIPRLGEPVLHGMGTLPVLRLTLPDSLWAGNQAYAKAEECLKLECHRFDLLTASYFQRTYTPAEMADSALDDDLDNTYVDEGTAPLPTGLEHVLKVGSFTWNEPKGEIIAPLTLTLESATKEIRSLLSVGGAYAAEGANEASGASKQMDFKNEDESLASYGHIICDALQDLYQLVARAQGYSYEDLSVSGLDKFGVDRLDNLLAQIVQFLSVDLSALERSLTPSLYQIVREKLLRYLVGNLTPQQMAIVEAEIAAIPVGAGAGGIGEVDEDDQDEDEQANENPVAD